MAVPDVLALLLFDGFRTAVGDTYVPDGVREEGVCGVGEGADGRGDGNGAGDGQ